MVPSAIEERLKGSTFARLPEPSANHYVACACKEKINTNATNHNFLWIESKPFFISQTPKIIIRDFLRMS
ncbi:MAG: hypothetical protein A2Y10_01420 [Planctomycetes bacterium GWF2_41_51]|nr:MAG: hypothetical protein A2Y10_01420 [Planctomycetes bacterium GWF2_41_51]HBG26714.1 hypothetical protein [Phycisphaerales bacterium]